MGINLGSGFGNLTGNTSNNAPTGGILNLNKKVNMSQLNYL